MAAARAEGVAEVRRLGVRRRFEVCRQALGGLVQGRGARRGHGKGVRPRRALRLRGCGGRWRAEHHVRVGPGEPEGAHPRRARPPRLRPRGGAVGHPHPHPVPGDLRARLVEVQVRRYLVVPEGEHCLDQARYPGRGLQVPDVGLHRTDQQRPSVGPARPDHPVQRGEFDRVAQRCARAVRLDVVHVGRVDAALGEGRADHLGLCVGARYGQPAGGAVVVDRGAADHRVDPVTVRLRPGQRLQDHRARALTAPVAVRGRVEGLAPPVGGERAARRHRQEHRGCQQCVGAADQHDVALARAQALAAQVHGGQRRGARGVHGEAGAAHAEEVRHAARAAGEGVAGAVVEIDLPGVARHHLPVVHRVQAHEQARTAAVQLLGAQPGVLQRLVRHFEEDPLLRVHAACFARRHPEEPVVEPVDPLDEATPPGRRPSGPGGPAGVVEQRLRVPPVPGHVRRGVHALGEQLPVRVQAGRAGQPAAHPDDGDGFRPVHPVRGLGFAPG